MFNSNTTIKELFDNGKISVRTHNSLLIAGMRTLGDVFDYIVTPRDLLTVRNFGYKSYTEMEPILNAIIHNSIEPIPTKEDGVIDQSDEITRIIKEAYQMVTDGDEVIKKWLQTFCRRFFSQQFKRSCMPDGPKVGSVSLSPRGDWRMPTDASAVLWLKDLEHV